MGCKYLLDLDGEDFRKKNSDDTSHLMILVSNKRAFHLCISLSEEKGREDQSAYDNWIHCKFSQYVIAGKEAGLIHPFLTSNDIADHENNYVFPRRIRNYISRFSGRR